MWHLFSRKSKHRLCVNPMVWSGPKTVVSGYLRTHGVNIKTLGINDTTLWFNRPQAKVTLIVVVK